MLPLRLDVPVCIRFDSPSAHPFYFLNLPLFDIAIEPGTNGLIGVAVFAFDAVGFGLRCFMNPPIEVGDVGFQIPVELSLELFMLLMCESHQAKFTENQKGI